MRVWSKGLGKIELVMDFEKYRVEREKEEKKEKLYIKGVIKDPVVWDFRITITKEDIPGILSIALNRYMILLFLKNLMLAIAFVFTRLFRRRKVTG